MAKRNGNGSLGRKVKMSQPVAIGFDRYIALVEGKVVKGPTVPKMEVMEKWIVSGGRDIESHRDRETGFIVVTLIAPGADGPVNFQGEGETLALAMMEAIHAYLKAQPKPDPEGRDLPLFRANGGSDADDDGADEGDGMPIGYPSDDGTFEEAEFEREEAGEFQENPPEAFQEPIEAVAADDEADGPDWTFLFVVDPQDLKRWKTSAPAVDGVAIVDFDEGDGENDRGWYLNPEYAYDRTVGAIAAKADPATPVWSRDAAREPAGV